MQKRYFKIALILFYTLLLMGCDDPIDSAYQWVDSLFLSYVEPIVCWLYTFFIKSMQAIVNFNISLVLGLLSVLPEYEVNLPDLSEYEFFRYAAYFLPLSEAATMMKYLIMFYVSFWVGRVVLRWLKIMR
ncbi:MAG: hypothetical protein C4560_01330 [Nitrospiraceae bacterium]|nr:MAG: hypothetical protein C4560_01330 [Nitrospiraceae bacterium]